MPSPVVLALVRGLIADARSARALRSSGVAHGSLVSSVPPVDPLALVLKGSAEPAKGADLRELLNDYGHRIHEITLGAPAAGDQALRAALADDASLVIVHAARDDDWRTAILPCRHANTIVIGIETSPVAGALLAMGPDIIAGVRVRARLIDIRPTILAHLEVLPTPGLVPEGRVLHEIFRWAHPDRAATHAVIEEIRSLGELGSHDTSGVN